MTDRTLSVTQDSQPERRQSLISILTVSGFSSRSSMENNQRPDSDYVNMILNVVSACCILMILIIILYVALWTVYET